MVYVRDKERYNARLKTYMDERYHRRRQEALEKLGGVCVECGVTEDLQFDHRRERGTKYKIIARMWSYSEERFWEEIAKCQLLCGECHYKKTCKEMGWTYRPKDERRPHWKKKPPQREEGLYESARFKT